jgi:hypothetical protein
VVAVFLHQIYSILRRQAIHPNEGLRSVSLLCLYPFQERR